MNRRKCQRLSQVAYGLFPARAGMNRSQCAYGKHRPQDTVPRTRGDEPNVQSPDCGAGAELFPARAGMNRMLAHDS